MFVNLLQSPCQSPYIGKKSEDSLKAQELICFGVKHKKIVMNEL